MAKTNITRMDGESEADFQRRRRSVQSRASFLKKLAAETPAERAERLRTTREYNREYRKKNVERLAVINARWYAKNVEKVHEATRQWRAKNPEKVRDIGRRNAAANPEARAASGRKWRQQNKARVSARDAQRRADRLRATPSWADQEAIRAIYREAVRRSREDGIAYDVDHHYPLRGRNVCGLHVESNLVILPAAMNRRKSNLHPDDWLPPEAP